MVDVLAARQVAIHVIAIVGGGSVFLIGIKLYASANNSH